MKLWYCVSVMEPESIFWFSTKKKAMEYSHCLTDLQGVDNVVNYVEFDIVNDRVAGSDIDPIFDDVYDVDFEDDEVDYDRDWDG